MGQICSSGMSSVTPYFVTKGDPVVVCAPAAWFSLRGCDLHSFVLDTQVIHIILPIVATNVPPRLRTHQQTAVCVSRLVPYLGSAPMLLISACCLEACAQLVRQVCHTFPSARPLCHTRRVSCRHACVTGSC